MNARVHPAEWQVQIAVVDHLKLRALPGVFWFGVMNGGFKADKRAIAKLKAMGLTPGVSDLCLIIRGHAYGLELKVPGGRQTPEQIAAGEAWTAAGGTYAVATGIDAALERLTEWGAIRPDGGARRMSDLLRDLDEVVP